MLAKNCPWTNLTFLLKKLSMEKPYILVKNCPWTNLTVLFKILFMEKSFVLLKLSMDKYVFVKKLSIEKSYIVKIVHGQNLTFR
jgi:hypothetical protein